MTRPSAPVLLAACIALVHAGAPLGLEAQLAPPLPLLRSPWGVEAATDGLGLAPVTLHNAYRSSWTDDRDNGALWAGKGLSGLLRGGVVWRRGPVRFALVPEVTWAHNGAFVLADGLWSGPERLPDFWVPDLPRLWGEGSTAQFHPGQSFVEARWDHLAVGVTTQSLIRGPEFRFPLILGTSAPGAPTAFVAGDYHLPHLGHAAVRAQWSVLKQSPHYDTPVGFSRHLFSAFFADWVPPAPAGLSLGASYTYRDPLHDFTPGMLGRPFGTTSAQDSVLMAGDGLAALHASWSFGGARLWGSWGRGDYSLDTEDLLTQLDYSQSWAAGASFIWSDTHGSWRLLGEWASVVGTNTSRGNPITYRHSVGFQGHTHAGQFLGASFGPGSAGTYLLIQHTDSTRTLGVEVERILRDLDAYHAALGRPDGSSGEDREWRFAALYEGPVPRLDALGWDVPGLSLRANGGLSFRWNRDYVRYSSNAHLVGPRETQLFLDLALTWNPRARKEDPRPPL